MADRHDRPLLSGAEVISGGIWQAQGGPLVTPRIHDCDVSQQTVKFRLSRLPRQKSMEGKAVMGFWRFARADWGPWRPLFDVIGPVLLAPLPDALLTLATPRLAAVSVAGQTEVPHIRLAARSATQKTTPPGQANKQPAASACVASQARARHRSWCAQAGVAASSQQLHAQTVGCLCWLGRLPITTAAPSPLLDCVSRNGVRVHK